MDGPEKLAGEIVVIANTVVKRRVQHHNVSRLKMERLGLPVLLWIPNPHVKITKRASIMVRGVIGLTAMGLKWCVDAGSVLTEPDLEISQYAGLGIMTGLKKLEKV